mmetsp:Transcript_12364/g.25167  ORF Transcript_12364/g.25167 Transcript_12364/m.25167 type:complete len:85 (-) Transcript_12364:235-489(-)|eukprot:CAMPEP_0167792700 /NCGR_PEP_ID=MMETSP0111_2-20121227/12705_1 /TAXON_ID=91324 /ORGANISM="Lotharella globosa, Strain CCCM811" /LENGTH=84 /DNA_ID=CAMNT_0007685645 /DNA_START=109 /DNA_END=363 /DNA_ORIENTATION=+
MSDEDWVIGFVCGIIGTLLGLGFIGFAGFLFIKCGTPRPTPYDKTKAESAASKEEEQKRQPEEIGETIPGGPKVGSNAKIAAEV